MIRFRLYLAGTMVFILVSLLQADSRLERTQIFAQLYSEDEYPPEKPAIKLSTISHEEFKRDLVQLLEIHRNLFRLIDSLITQINREHSSDVYTTEEEDSLRGTWLEILNFRSIIFRVMARYDNNSFAAQKNVSKRNLFLNFGLTIFLNHAMARIIIAARENDMAWRKLNEGDISWNLEDNILYEIQKDLADPRTKKALEKGFMDYRQVNSELEEMTEMRWLHKVIEDGVDFFEKNDSILWKNRFELYLKPLKDLLYRPYYYMAESISTWISNFRYKNRPPMMNPELLTQLLDQIEPGDLILERRHFYLTNVVLPGYWPHVVLYVGTRQQMQELGLLTRPELQRTMLELESQNGGSGTHFFVDAQTYGVVLTTETKRMELDSVAVLRPRLPLSIKRQAIWRALNYLGKPYDFEFDFFSADKIVCSEVIYRAYGSHLKFQLSKILGRMTLPPVNIANSYVQSRSEPNRTLDFILFFKGNPGQINASPVSEEEFVRTMRSGENPLAPASSSRGMAQIWP